MKVEFELEYEDKKTKARLGKIIYNGKEYSTPLFMPVGTQATVKSLSPEELKEIGSSIVLANTYHLWLRPGEDIVAKAGGLHKFMNYDGPILTDSGGFQVFSLAKPKDINEDGVKFKNHLNGDNLFLTPEKSIEIQEKLGSDIVMSFDECVKWPSTYDYVKGAVERTLDWAKRGKNVFKGNNQILFGIVQGGEYADLRKYCAEKLVEMDFDGYSVGGTSVGENKQTMYKMVEYSTEYLPKDKLRYLMGVGDPIDLIENVMRGIDIFDCVAPTRLARHGHAYTRNGKINLKNSKYKDDFNPVEENCHCYACENYSKAYIKHLIQNDEMFGARLLSIHNIYFLTKLMEDIRNNIQSGTLEKFRDEFILSYYGKDYNYE